VHTLVLCLFGAAFGASLGSFLGCAAYRLPRRLSLRGRSFCPTCHAPVPVHHNLPLLGFLLLRGRTACCHTRLSRHYLAYEASCTVAGAALAALVGLPTLLISEAVVIGATLVAAAVRARL